MLAILDWQHCTPAETSPADPEDRTAELIAGLSEREADLLWAALIQLKPNLRD